MLDGMLVKRTAGFLQPGGPATSARAKVGCRLLLALTMWTIVTASAASQPPDAGPGTGSRGVQAPVAPCACPKPTAPPPSPAPGPRRSPGCPEPDCTAVPRVFPSACCNLLLVDEALLPPLRAPIPETPPSSTGAKSTPPAPSNTITFKALGISFSGSGELALMAGVLGLGAILVGVVAVVTLWTTFKSGSKNPGQEKDPSATQPPQAANASLRWRVGLLGVGALIVVSMFWLASRLLPADSQPLAVPVVRGAPLPPAAISGQPVSADQLARLGEQLAALQEAQRLLLNRPTPEPVTWPMVTLCLLAGVAASLLVLVVLLARDTRRPGLLGRGERPASREHAAQPPTLSPAQWDNLRAQRAILQDSLDELMAKVDGWLPKTADSASLPKDSGTAQAATTKTTSAPEYLDLRGLLKELSAALALLEQPTGDAPRKSPGFEWRLPEAQAYPAQPLKLARTELAALFDETDRLLAADAMRRLGAEQVAESFRGQLRRLRERLRRWPHQPPG